MDPSREAFLMPYYITEDADDCSGWAVVKDDGEQIGCHETKQAAVDQMVAVSIAEGIEPGGERSDEQREVDLSPPAYIREAARQGLAFHEEGLSGDGLRPQTVREARQIAAGEISDDKIIRMSAWGARHEPDLRAEGARPGQDGYPTPGAVAHLLWGIPTGSRYDDARAWIDRKAQQVKDERTVVDVPPVAPRSRQSGVEFRELTGEIRAADDGTTFVGYAAMFDSPSQPLPFVERIAPGAFARSLRNRKRDIRLYVNHNSDLVLASKRSGTLRLREDDQGLRVEAQMPDTTYARDLTALMNSGVVDKMSFGFSVPAGGDEWNADGSERTLRSVVLHEVSVVTGFPAYEQTAAAVRSLERLATRTGIAVDDLTETLDAIGEGAEVDPARVEALISALTVALPEQAAPEPTGLGVKGALSDLLLKKVL